MNKVVVITGASSGIGLETAKLFKESCKVYNLSRTSGGIEGIIHIPTDVSSEESVRRAFDIISENEGKVDLLINNAGMGISGALEFTETADAKRIFDVNFFGMFFCCKYALPLLRKTCGRIINVSSAAAIFPIPFQGFYSATKSAVNSFTLCLKNELEMFGISVCAIMPGDVKTGFTKARVKNEKGEEIYRGAIKKSVGVMERDEINGMSPSDIARFIYKISKKRRIKPLYSIGFIYKLYSFLFKILPVGVVNRIVGMIYISKK